MIPSLDFKDFNESAVQVWDNVTFADRYYQDLANPKEPTFTSNGRKVNSADFNVD